MTVPATPSVRPPGGQQEPDPAGDVVALRDGRTVRVRPVRPDDGDALAEAFLRLSGESQRLRFGSAPRMLNAAALRQLVGTVDGVDHVAFAGFERGRLVGVGRILRYPDDRDTLDVAVTIADDYQGVGLGRVLADLLAVYRPRPARRIVTQINGINDRALTLLATFGAVTRTTEDDVLIEVDDEPAVPG